MANQNSSPWRYYAFLVWCAAMTVIFGVWAKGQHDLKLSLDKLPDHDLWVLPWYLPAALSLASAVVLVVAIRKKRIV